MGQWRVRAALQHKKPVRIDLMGDQEDGDQLGDVAINCLGRRKGDKTQQYCSEVRSTPLHGAIAHHRPTTWCEALRLRQETTVNACVNLLSEVDMHWLLVSTSNPRPLDRVSIRNCCVMLAVDPLAHCQSNLVPNQQLITNSPITSTAAAVSMAAGTHLQR
jgi:hypothetical protein